MDQDFWSIVAVANGTDTLLTVVAWMCLVGGRVGLVFALAYEDRFSFDVMEVPPSDLPYAIRLDRRSNMSRSVGQWGGSFPQNQPQGTSKTNKNWAGEILPGPTSCVSLKQFCAVRFNQATDVCSEEPRLRRR